MPDGSLEKFAAFYQLSAHYRRRLMDDQEPLTREERLFLLEMLTDYESLMTRSRDMMLRFKALGLLP